MKRIFVMTLVMTVLCPILWAQAETSSSEQKIKDSYCVGYEFGANLNRQGVEVDAETLLAAIKSGLAGEKPTMNPREIRETLLQLQKKVMVLADNRQRERARKNLEDGAAFLSLNGKKEGVKTLPSGLQYKVIREGTGPIPKETELARVHYRGALIDGTEFDSSYGRGEPATIPVHGVIKGWKEALQLMKTGSKWELFIPASLAYGERQFGRIPPNATLLFEVELLSVTEDPDLGLGQLKPEGGDQAKSTGHDKKGVEKKSVRP